MKRIVSLLPAGTEIVVSLGRQNELVGRSHECDWPPEVKSLPVLTSATGDPLASSSAIDQHVKNAQGTPLFTVDESLLTSLAPDLIVTQAACDVCAVDAKQVSAIADTIRLADGTSPDVLTLSPESLGDLFSDIVRVGKTLGATEQANHLVDVLKKRCENVVTQCHALSDHHSKQNIARPHIALIEWLDPPMSAGNWVPEMIQMVGATDALGADGGKSHWIDWADVAAADPDVVILIPCGFELQRVLTEAKTPAVWPHLKDLRATREGNLFAVDGHHLFNRPGPRLIDSLEVLAEIVHPELFQFKATTQFAKRIES
jgi:iron complex transport system substrate-binding protein